MNSNASANPTTTGSITTVLQYATIAAVGYGIYYTRQKANSRQAPQANRAVTDTETLSEKTAKKQRVEQYAREASSQKQKPSKTQPKTSQSPKQNAAVEDDADDELNNKEFAQQLASLKEGKKFTAASGGDKKKKRKQKSVKQSQAQVHEPVEVSAPSSTGGIDADDDQSPPTSPQVAAAGGVDDMLEAPAPGPGSMRIVASETSQPQKAKAQKQAAEPALSKKQKQRRRKAEANRAAAEDAEKDRKALMEKQRRLARVSEGRAAKDGSQFMAAVNGQNAWKAGQPNGAAAKPSTETAPVLLDTFEKPASNPAPKKASTSGKGEAWISSVPSEEEQMERLKSETEADEWSTVTTKKPKKASSVTEEKVVEPPVAAPKAPQTSQSTQKLASAPNGKPAPASGYGSFSGLTVEDPESEEELEWDV